MATIAVSAQVAAPLERVWSILETLDHPEIGKAIAERVEIEDEAGTPVRTLHLAAAYGGGCVRERIEELDATHHRLTYRVIDAGPVPMIAYRGSFTLEPLADATRIDYTAEFSAPDEARLAQIAIGNFQTYVADLARVLDASWTSLS
jgi:hypothetical protein